MAIQETFISSEESPYISGYKGFNNPRKKRLGGGVALYWKKDLCVKKIRAPVMFTSEMIGVAVYTSSEKLDIFSFYAPPNTYAEDMIEMDGLSDSNFIILGDFNVDARAIEDNDCPKFYSYKKRFTNIRNYINRNHLKVIKGPKNSLVSVRGTTSNPDFAICSENIKTILVENVRPRISDHCAISYAVKHANEKRSVRMGWAYKKQNLRLYVSTLENELNLLSGRIEELSTDELNDRICEIFIQSAEKTCKKFRLGGNPPN